MRIRSHGSSVFVALAATSADVQRLHEQHARFRGSQAPAQLPASASTKPLPRCSQPMCATPEKLIVGTNLTYAPDEFKTGELTRPAGVSSWSPRCRSASAWSRICGTQVRQHHPRRQGREVRRRLGILHRHR